MKSYVQTFDSVLSCLAYSLSIILNAVGIYILPNLKTELTNQRIFLMNLSVTELLYSSVTFCYFFTVEFSDKESIARTIFGKLSWLLYYLYLIPPLFLAADRLFCIVLPWKYKAICTKTKALTAILSTWICVILAVSPIFFLGKTDYETAGSSYLPLVAIGIVSFVTSFAIVAYTLIGLKVYRQGKLTGRTSNGSKTVLKVTACIIVTYFVFEAVPYIIVKILEQCCHNVGKTYGRLIYAFGRFNTVSDPVIYIYSYPPLKAVVKKKLTLMLAKLGCSQRQDSEKVTPEPSHTSDTPV